MLNHCLIATGFGPVGLAWSDAGLRRLQLPTLDCAATRARLLDNIEAEEAHPPDWLAPAVGRLQRYFAGMPTRLDDTPLDLAGIAGLPRRLYTEMLTLGWGETLTYGELALRVGIGSAQAVGRAMGQNPMPIIIPCHRILASGNRMGGFSAPGGARTKLRLLEMEGVAIGAPRGQMAFAFTPRPARLTARA